MITPELRVAHIIECIDRIERYTTDGKNAFMKSQLIQDAVVRNLETLSDAVKGLPEELKTRHPKVPWRDMGGFRNVLAHQYLTVAVERVWAVVVDNLPALKVAVKSIAEQLRIAT